MKNNSVTFNTNFKDVLYYWLKFTKPFHNLAEQPMRVLALLLLKYFNYKEIVKDDKVLWKMVFDYDTKVEIITELDIKDYTLENKLTQLRKKGIIVNNTINKKYIPNLDLNTKEYNINFKFNIND